MLIGENQDASGALRSEAHDRGPDRSPPIPWPEDRYLSSTSLRDASAALHGLAATLDQVRGAFVDDAGEDAARLHALAEDLAAWCRNPGFDIDPRPGHGPQGPQHWTAVLRVYFRRSLIPAADHRRATRSDGSPT